MVKQYLTEESLQTFLETHVAKEWIHNKSFITRLRPDYRNDDLKMIVEFDGYMHYTNAARILKDIEKELLYSSQGYRTIRIPYFVQLDKAVIKKLFNLDIDYELSYPHGFIDDKCILPADFCELGIARFKEDLSEFDFLRDDILASLKNKIEKLGDINLVLPPSMQCIMK